MTQELAAHFLTSDSDEINDLKANLSLLEGFIDLVCEINELPDTKHRFFEESRSLYQVTSSQEIDKLEALLSKFFGPPVKPCDKPLPRKLCKDSVVKYLGGIQKDQSLFIVSLKTGQFYGALWPWRRNRSKIEIHLGYCSGWMSNDDYEQLETLVKKSISQRTFEQKEVGIGSQIHGISLPSFLQMAEMEKSSFSLRITCRNQVGNLHLNEGKLLAADLDGGTGAQAAYEIISWDEALIEIEPLDASKTDEIHQPLILVLMESLKVKDEGVVSKVAPSEQQPQLEKGEPQAQKPAPRFQRPVPGRLVRLERAPEPKIKRRKVNMPALAVIALSAFGIIAVVIMAGLHLSNNRKAPDLYEQTLSKVNQATSLEQKRTLLKEYLDTHPGSEHVMQIQTKLLEVNQKIIEREYDKVKDTVSKLPIDEVYEQKAMAAYEQFLEKYPNSRQERKFKQSIVQIKDLIDQHYYNELKLAARLEFNDRLKIYRNYLEKFPEGSYSQDVKILLEKMGKRYLQNLNAEAEKCETRQQWEPCLKRYDEFINAYQGMPLAQTAENLKTRMVDKRDFLQLRRQVLDTGTDYQNGYKLYQSYLADHPQSTQKDAIKKEMAELSVHLKGQRQWLEIKKYATDTKNSQIKRIRKVDQYLKQNSAGPFAADARSLLDRLEAERILSLRQQQMQSQKRKEQERIQREKALKIQQQQRILQFRAQIKSQLSGSKRFRTSGNDTVVDQTTGLTWTLLDSKQELGGCLTYKAAQTYVQNLSHGGKRDWRFPTAGELASLYKKPPFFPSAGNQWYWSAEIYAKGYHSVCVVVTDKPETIFKREHRRLSECGVVRAVR